MERVVYIVHCVDAEGPLYESLEATFERIHGAFGIKIEPTQENLIKLQNKQLNLLRDEDAVAKFVSQKLLNYNDSWAKIDKMLDEITSNTFRNELTDSYGGGWIYNWFCIDHVGFTGENPRRRDLGFHKIFDHYRSYNKLHKIESDLIQWHFHPLSLRKDAHRCGSSYVSSNIVFEILSRKIIDRKWFPAVFRPGFHSERPDSNWFLEQWIPFDYGNQAMKDDEIDQPDLASGRFGDWRRSPKEWKAYHPDHDDYQKEGNCRRWIIRCLNMLTRLREITIEDIRDGFERVKSGKPTIISFTNHDFRDMKSEINKLRNMIKKVSKEYQNIKFKFSNAIEAMRGFMGAKEIKNPDFLLQIEKIKNGTILKIKAKNDIFGPQPFLAIKTKMDQYFWENFDFQGKNQWSYTFDFNTLDIDDVDKVGVAANTKYGATEVVVLDIEKNKIEKNILNNNY